MCEPGQADSAPASVDASVGAPPRWLGGVRFESRLASRYLASGRGIVAAVTLVCALGVMVGVAALVLALALMNGLQGDVRQRLLASNPHVLLEPGWGRSGWDRGRAAELAGAVTQDPRVVATAPQAVEHGLLRSRLVPGGVPVLVKAVDPPAEDGVTGLASRVAPLAWKSLSDAAAPGEVAEVEPPDFADEPAPLAELEPPDAPPALLGSDLALSLGVGVGDTVHLVSGRPELSALGPVPRSRAHRVAGIVDTGLTDYDRSWMIVPLMGDATSLQVAVADPLEAAAVADDLARRLGPEIRVEDWTTTFSRLFAAFRWERLVMMLTLGLIGLVAGFNIFTILTMNVLARVEEVGVLSALGATRAAITRVFLYMGLGLGAVGTAVGLGVGTGLAVLLDSRRLIALDPSVYLVSHVPFRVDAGDLAVVAAGMLLVSLLASVVPARVAARLDPIVALRAG